MYEIAKIYSGTNIEVLPQVWWFRKQAEKAAEDLNQAEEHKSGGWIAALSGVGPAKWQAMTSRTVDALTKHAFALHEAARIKEETRSSQDDKCTVAEDAP